VRVGCRHGLETNADYGVRVGRWMRSRPRAGP
jgi:hypothetical protein